MFGSEHFRFQYFMCLDIFYYFINLVCFDRTFSFGLLWVRSLTSFISFRSIFVIISQSFLAKTMTSFRALCVCVCVEGGGEAVLFHKVLHHCNCH